MIIEKKENMERYYNERELFITKWFENIDLATEKINRIVLNLFEEVILYLRLPSYIHIRNLNKTSLISRKLIQNPVFMISVVALLILRILFYINA